MVHHRGAGAAGSTAGDFCAVIALRRVEQQRVITAITVISCALWILNFAGRVVDPTWPVGMSAALDPVVILVAGWWFAGAAAERQRNGS